MKKILSCFLAIVILSAIFVMGASAMVGNEYANYGEIPFVKVDPTKPIRRDGVKESYYANATPIEIKYLHNGKIVGEDGAPAAGLLANDPSVADLGKRVTDVKGTAYVIYDGTYIWIYVEVNDTTLATHAADPLSSTYKEDSVELCIDWLNAGKDETLVCPYQARISHEGYISARLGSAQTAESSMFGSVDDGGPAPVTWLEGMAQHRADGSGYDCEFRINVPQDKFDNAIDGNISISFMINDYDETGALASRVMITSDNVQASGQWKVGNFGYMKFTYVDQPATGDMTLVYVAIAMVLALGIGAVTVVSMKKSKVR